MAEKKGRSPTLRRKNWIEQQSCRSPSPDLYSVLELQKKLLNSLAENKKVPIYCKHTISSILYAQNVKRPDVTNFPRRSVDKKPISKVMPTKTKSNEDKLSSSYTKTSSSKHDPRTHFQSRNVKSQKKPTKKTVDAKTEEIFHDDLLSSTDDHNVTTYEECDKISPSESNDGMILIVEDDNNQHLTEDLQSEMEFDHDKILECELILVPIHIEGDADMSESNTCSSDDVMIVESVSNEHLNDHNDGTNQQDQEICETFDVDTENPKMENEEVVQEERKAIEQQEVRKEEEPNKEDRISKMVVEYQHVVTHGKKDIVAYNNDVTEETTMISNRREQRSNKVKALVGAFESVMSDETHVFSKRLLRKHQ